MMNPPNHEKQLAEAATQWQRTAMGLEQQLSNLRRENSTLTESNNLLNRERLAYKRVINKMLECDKHESVCQCGPLSALAFDMFENAIHEAGDNK